MLVVDDNPVNRRILARQVELAGASTDTAAGGAEALELTRRGPYDLVLADLQMPEMDGFELARRIRGRENDEQLPRTPILSGRCCHSSAWRCRFASTGTSRWHEP